VKAPADLKEATDQQVVEWALDGNEWAYRDIVRRYERPIFSLIYRMVRDRERAEDLAQDSFVKALKALASYRPQYKFSSWIFKIANNVSIDHLRKKELDTLSLDGPPDDTGLKGQGPLQIGDRVESPLEEMEAREIGSEIEQAIARMRPEYQTCVLLRYVDGRPYEEIAEIMELPLGTIKTYIHRARAELKGYLTEEDG
jgi:RNA polymerase sigma-70 factor (ECF subfamily)